MATISIGTLEAMRAQAQPLLEQHWAELAPRKHLMGIDPQWDRYEQLEKLGCLLILLAHDEDNQLVGYSVNVVMQHMHFANLRYCHNDLLFVAPANRNAGLGRQLIKATEIAAKESGAELLVWHTRPATALELVLRRRGYAPDFIYYAKELNHG